MPNLLTFAVDRLDVDLVKFALELGADPNHHSGNTAFDIICERTEFLQRQSSSIFYELTEYHDEFFHEYYEKLFDGEDDNDGNYQKISRDPVIIENNQKRRKYIEILELLILHGLNLVDKIGYCDDIRMIRMLFKHGSPENPYKFLCNDIERGRLCDIEIYLFEIIPRKGFDEKEFDDLLRITAMFNIDNEENMNFLMAHFIRFFEDFARERLSWFLRKISNFGRWSDILDCLKRNVFEEMEYFHILGGFLTDDHCVCNVYGYASDCNICSRGYEILCCQCSDRKTFIETRKMLIEKLSETFVREKILSDNKYYHHKSFIISVIILVLGKNGIAQRRNEKIEDAGVFAEFIKQDELEIFKKIVRYAVVDLDNLWKSVQDIAGPKIKKFMEEYISLMS